MLVFFKGDRNICSLLPLLNKEYFQSGYSAVSCLRRIVLKYLNYIIDMNYIIFYNYIIFVFIKEKPNCKEKEGCIYILNQFQFDKLIINISFTNVFNCCCVPIFRTTSPPREPQRNVSIAAVRGAVRPSKECF